MRTVRVRFENVGVMKQSWEADLPSPLTVHSLIRSIRIQGALLSRDIEFSEDAPHGFGGSIYVGMFRNVGTWRVLEAGTLSGGATSPTTGGH